MKPLTKLLLLTSALGIATYGGLVLYRQQQLLNDSSLTFRGLKIKFVNALTATLSGTLRFQNKSAYSFKIISQHLTIYLNNQAVGSVDNANVIQVDAQSTSDIPIAAQFNLASTVGSAIVGGVQNAQVIIRGKIYVKHSIFFLWVPVDIAYNASEIIL